jgi:hypothetical protein
MAPQEARVGVKVLGGVFLVAAVLRFARWQAGRAVRRRAAAAAIPVRASGVLSAVQRTPCRCAGIAASLPALAPRNDGVVLSTSRAAH